MEQSQKQLRKEIQQILKSHPEIAPNWRQCDLSNVGVRLLLQKLKYLKKRLKEKEIVK